MNNLVEQYLVFAEGQAMRRIPMYMQDWIDKLNGFLSLNDRDILNHAGKISHELALEKAEKEYDKYNSVRIETDSKSIDDLNDSIKKIKNKLRDKKK